MKLFATYLVGVIFGVAGYYVTLRHVVKNATSNSSFILSDESPLLAGNVLVQIYDDDIAGVVVKESKGITATAEVNSTVKDQVLAVQGGDASFYQDEYTLRLTKKPDGIVKINIDSKAVATDFESQFTPSYRDLSQRKQVKVNGQETAYLEFDNSTWAIPQTVNVTAIDDLDEEGVDWLNFASQPEYLALIQGPIRLAAGISPFIPPISDPVTLPEEINGAVFDPPNVTIDRTSSLVFESKQVDTLVIYNRDVRGNESSNGFLTAGQFTGMNMAQNIYVAGTGPFTGIYYESIEVVEFFLGDGVDKITVENTSAAIHAMHLGKGDDDVRVKNIAGHFMVNGGEGSDTVTVASDASKLDRIQALLAVDGGKLGEDKLVLENSADDGVDDVLNVTRLLVEVESMRAVVASPTNQNTTSSNATTNETTVETNQNATSSNATTNETTVETNQNATSSNATTNETTVEVNNPILPWDSYLVNLKNATSGTFRLGLSDPSTNQTNSTSDLDYSISAEDMELALQQLLIPEKKTCGKENSSKCSNAVRVWRMGDSDVFAVFFVGERLGGGVTLDLFTDSLDFDSETFLNSTNDILAKNSDVAYTNVEVLDSK